MQAIVIQENVMLLRVVQSIYAGEEVSSQVFAILEIIERYEQSKTTVRLCTYKHVVQTRGKRDREVHVRKPERILDEETEREERKLSKSCE